jgi:GntR family transcriptional regulator
MAITFHINPGSNTPIYQQITEQVRLAVAGGSLRVGDQLPSVRALAEELVVNPNTVARAYGDLIQAGLLESRSGRGVFITPKRKVYSREDGWRRLEPLLDSLIGEAMVLDFTPEEVRAALEEKLRQWKPAKGNKINHE